MFKYDRERIVEKFDLENFDLWCIKPLKLLSTLSVALYDGVFERIEEEDRKEYEGIAHKMLLEEIDEVEQVVKDAIDAQLKKPIQLRPKEDNK